MSDVIPELERKREALLAWFQQFSSVGVAFSAGVDSTVVAQAAFLTCGERAIAFTASSPSVPSREIEQARELAREIGIRHEVLTTSEFENSRYRENPTNRCYFCKFELYTHLEAMGDRLGVEVLVNGANFDDRGDHRPGMLAAREFQVRSPLLELEITKTEIRKLARFWNLTIWDKPASPCLSSRIAYGVEVTPERVQRIDAAEQFLRELLCVRELRVRLEERELARIELPLSELSKLVEAEKRNAVTQHFLALGFRNVTLDLQGFRSGSQNEGLVNLQLFSGFSGASDHEPTSTRICSAETDQKTGNP